MRLASRAKSISSQLDFRLARESRGDFRATLVRRSVASSRQRARWRNHGRYDVCVSSRSKPARAEGEFLILSRPKRSRPKAAKRGITAATRSYLNDGRHAMASGSVGSNELLL